MKCPSCASIVLVEGEIDGDLEWERGQRFVPKDLRGLALGGVRLEKRRKLFACTACGLVWSRVDPAELVELLETKGNDAVRKRMKRHRVR